MATSEDQIAEIECRFGVRLPDDYRRFLLTRGSMSEFLPPADSYVQIGPIDDVIPVNKAGDIQRRFPGALVIGSDGSREMLAYDFRQCQSRLVLLDLTAQDWSDAVYQASSLAALLAQLPERGWLFD
jgi:SMI1 / KNR4 family (SUKH-1)